MKKLFKAVSGVVASATMLFGVALQATPASAGSPATIPYTASVTVSPPTPSSYAGAGGGDGWGLAFTQNNVYNVFHHDSILQVECHVQATAAQCSNNNWPLTITDNSNDSYAGDSFASSSQPTVWINQNTGYLYVYATAYGPNNPSTSGVVCVDTGSNAPDPFCGFTPLSSPGGSPLLSGISNVSNAVIVNNNFYAFNFVSTDAQAPADATTQNTMMCFSLTTFTACPLQPFSVGLEASTLPVNSFPSPSLTALGSKIIIPYSSPSNSSVFTCFDTSTIGTCSGNWPLIDANASGPTLDGATLPVLDPSTNLSVGFCERSTAECWDTSGNSIPTPTGLSAMPSLAGGAGWTGPPVQVGSRIYFETISTVDCYDYATSAECQSYPLQLQNFLLGYSVNIDPNRPACIWVNSDSGSGQIQNFDAYTTGACGSSGDRVAVSQFVAPGGTCNPSDYTSIQVMSPSPATYSGGTVQFEDSDGNPLGTALPLDSTGSLSLAGLNFSTLSALPQALINLPGAPTVPVTVQLSWTGSPSVACDLVPGSPIPATATVTDNGNSTGTAVISWVAPSSDGGTPVTSYVVYAQPGGFSCTAPAGQTSCTISNLPNYTNYNFLVEAINAVGTSQPAISNPAGVAPGAATNVAPPTISGPTAIGSTLTATSGTWSIDTGTYAYQWYTCTDTPPSNPTSDTNCTTVGSNQNTYVVQSSDLGNRVFVTVTATGTDASTTSIWSNILGPMVQTGPAVNTLAPVVSGSTSAGTVLTATTGNWTSGTNTFTYQWKVCNGANCTNVGTNSATYTSTLAQVGQTVTVTVSDQGTDGSTSTATSSAFGPLVTPPAPAVNTVAPAISGSKTVGNVLTATSGTWTSGTNAFTYQWQSCTGSSCTNVGTNASTYTTVSGDVGMTIKVIVTETGTNASTTSATSSGYGPIRAAITAQAPLRISNYSLANTIGSSVTLMTSGGSGSGSVSYVVSGSGCVLKAGVLTATQLGACVVTATKAASTGYTAITASAVRFSFVAAPRSVLGSVHFGVNSTVMSANASTALTVTVNAALAKYAKVIIVTGYASQSGPLALNLKLSATRATVVADAIRKILVARHVSGVTVQSVAGGVLTKFASEAQNIEATIQG